MRRRTGTVAGLAGAMMVALTLRAGAAPAVVLNPDGVVHGSVIHLADLWSGLGDLGRTALGPGPAPGQSITVPPSQLAAIAKAYGVNWTPRATSAVIRRPGQMVDLAAILAVLKPALAAEAANAGQTDGVGLQVSVPDFQSPMVDTGAPPHVVLDSLQYNGTTPQFAAMMAVDTPDGEIHFRLIGNVYTLRQAVVAAHVLQAGRVISAGDLAVRPVRAVFLADGGGADPALLVGQQLRHVVREGAPVTAADVERPMVVRRMTRVMMDLDLPGLSVSAVGEALQDGAVGDQIFVRNATSGAKLSAQVIGNNHVRVDPSAPPAMPDPEYRTMTP